MASDTQRSVEGRSVAPVGSRGTLYMGGPVDYSQEDHQKAWQHWPEWEEIGFAPYCPKCECQGLSDSEIIYKNKVALLQAEVCLLDLRGKSIGTPIEMFWRVWDNEASAILIVSPGSVFVRYTTRTYKNVFVVSSPKEALMLLGGEEGS